MFQKLGIPILLACVPACLLADFSYEESTKVTGGMMAGVMKFAGASILSNSIQDARNP